VIVDENECEREDKIELYIFSFKHRGKRRKINE